VRCAQCLVQPPPFQRARAALLYDDESRELVLRFKHADRTDAAPALASMMARAGRELIGDADFMVPVPLHWTRLWRRSTSGLAVARASGSPAPT
jgi:predicted amidophosphoribosyltransferase